MSDQYYKPVPALPTDKSLPKSNNNENRTHVKQRAAEEKTQLFSMLQAMKEGRMPHNDQLKDIMFKLINNKAISSREHLMSNDGKTLLNDFRALLKTMQTALNEKNKEELFQSLVYHLHCIDSPLSKDHLSQTAQEANPNQIQQESKEGGNAIFKIAKLILVNNEFRSVLGELIDISQDIFSNMSHEMGDSLQQAAGGLQDPNNQPNKPGRKIVDDLIDNSLNRDHNNHSPNKPSLMTHNEHDPRHSGLLETGDSVYPGREHHDNHHSNINNMGQHSISPTFGQSSGTRNPLDHSMYTTQGDYSQQSQFDRNQSLHDKGTHPVDQSQIPQTDSRGHVNIYGNDNSTLPNEHMNNLTSRSHGENLFSAPQPSHGLNTQHSTGQHGLHGDNQYSTGQPGLHGNNNQYSTGQPGLHGNNNQYSTGQPGLHGNNNQYSTGHQGLHADNQLSTGRQGLHGNNQVFGQSSNNDGVNQVQNDANQKLQQAEHHLGEKKERAQHIIQERVPEDKQHELVDRLRTVIGQVQQNPEYQSAIDTIIHLFKTWSSRLGSLTDEVKTKAQQNDNSQQQQFRTQAERETKALIETWAQGKSMDPLLHSIKSVQEDMRNDQELRQFYNRIVDYVDRLARQPGYAADRRSTDEGRQLMDDSNRIIKGKYDDHLKHLSHMAKDFMNAMAEDRVARELNERFTAIHRDLWFDRDGNPAFKPHLLEDMKNTLLPAFMDEIKFIPIPRIEYSDAQYDVIIENLILSGDSLLPNVFETKIESYNKFSLREAVPSTPSHQTLFVRMSEIQADIDDVVFAYTKKTGFPKMTDRGVASLTVGGKGITMSVRIQAVTDNPAKTFKVTHCKCNVANLKVKVNDSKHDVLYKTISPFVVGIIRKQVARALEAKMIETLNSWDQTITTQLMHINENLQKKSYERLPESEKADPRNRPLELSQARQRPGLFTTLVNVFNSSVKNRIDKRNTQRRESQSSHKSRRRSSHGFRNKDRHQNRHSTDNHNLEQKLEDKFHKTEDPTYTGKPRQRSIVSPPHSPVQKAADPTHRSTAEQTNPTFI
ncbi:hypothetical protein BDB01DRAFT_900304 [Pilobolus umbonatus]|nr:hypothetical protein BDB01DRAFT_900304 [Pilobolus umbonatus]